MMRPDYLRLVPASRRDLKPFTVRISVHRDRGLPFRSRPTQEYVKKLFDYDPLTGELRWKVTRSRTAHIGDVAGHAGTGYRVIRIDGRNYKASHLVWLWMTGKPPQKTIDHKDRDSLNDSWENLREATMTQQLMNRGLRSDNRSGCPGVFWKKACKKWCAEVKANGQRMHLGYFDNLDAAVACNERLTRLYHGEFARNA